MATILLVEDNEMNRDMLSRRLERRGHKILIAVDGEEGLLKTEAELPDIILMDMSLPKIDGWETTRRIKQNPKTAGIPIIALTAHAMKSDEDRAREAGCNDFDTKPVDLNRLLEKINRQLNSAKGEN
ncbi:MAG: response regulator receiver protein [Verrucomicrobiales bacterium]|nr:response regulator receiver protein [Verrucomicrobiales bacterium]